MYQWFILMNGWSSDYMGETTVYGVYNTPLEWEADPSGLGVVPVVTLRADVMHSGNNNEDGSAEHPWTFQTTN